MRLLTRSSEYTHLLDSPKVLEEQQKKMIRVLKRCYRLLDITEFCESLGKDSIRIKAVCKSPLKGFTTVLTSAYEALTKTVSHKCLIMQQDLPYRLNSHQAGINFLHRFMAKAPQNTPILSVNLQTCTISVGTQCSFTQKAMGRETLLVKQGAFRVKQLLRFVDYQLHSILARINEPTVIPSGQAESRQRKILETKMHIMFSCLDLGISQKTDQHRAINPDKNKQKQDLIQQIREEGGSQFDSKELKLYCQRPILQQIGQSKGQTDFANAIEIPSYFEQFLKSPAPTNSQGQPLYIFNEIEVLNGEKAAFKKYAETLNSTLSTTVLNFKHVPIVKKRKDEEGPVTRMMLLKDSGSKGTKAANRLVHQKNILKLFSNAQSSYFLQYYEDKTKDWAHKTAIMMDFDPQTLSLGEFLVSHRNCLTLMTKLSILGHVANGLRFLHYYKVIHMDLNPNNVLINELNRPKLIDFGQAYYQPQGHGQHQSGYTLPYCPPEVFSANKYNSAQDMFSFGVVAFKVISGELPFRATDSLINIFRKRQQATRWMLAAEKVLDCGPADTTGLLLLLFSKCLSAATESRPLPVWTTIILRQLLLLDR